MDLKIFKRKLDAYGADFARWEGVDERGVRAFMAQSATARELYAQAEKLDRALDSFGVMPPRHPIMGGVQSRIGAAGGRGATIMPFPLRIETPPWKVAGMGLAAAAAMVLLVFATIGEGTITNDVSSASAVAAATGTGQGQIDAFVSEIASWMEEDEQAEEILAMLDTNSAARDEREIDEFLEDFYDGDENYVAGPGGAKPDFVPEPDIWDVFYPGTDSP